MTKSNEPEVIITKERMTVEYLMETYSMDQLMRIFKFQMVNNVQAMTPKEVDRVLALPGDSEELQRPDRAVLSDKGNEMLDLLEGKEQKDQEQLDRIEANLDRIDTKMDNFNKGNK